MNPTDSPCRRVARFLGRRCFGYCFSMKNRSHFFNIPSFLDIRGKELAESGRSYHSFYAFLLFLSLLLTFFTFGSFFFLRPRDTRLIPN